MIPSLIYTHYALNIMPSSFRQHLPYGLPYAFQVPRRGFDLHSPDINLLLSTPYQRRDRLPDCLLYLQFIRLQGTWRETKEGVK